MTTGSARASAERSPTPRAPADPVEELARSRFGIECLLPIQRFVIANSLEGTPQIVILPTGSGKSLCFQLPALLLGGPTLVLMPLLSLLADQLRRLRETGVEVGELRGGQEPAERERLYASIRRGATRIVLATPEACMAPRTASELTSLRFAHLVVDEAHCVSEWGDSFRPSYLRLGELARALGAPLITAFTATASPQVVRRIREVIFGEEEPAIVAGSSDRPNIRYEVRRVLARMRAIEELAAAEARPALVFCRRRDSTEMRARETKRRMPDAEVLFYHAGLTRSERAAVERRFLASSTAVLFATSAYGLGVDKADIRTVVHADVPPSVEAYLQETGRAGRDGKPSRAFLLVGREDREFVARLPEGTERGRLERMMGYALGSAGCRRNALLALISEAPVACSGCDLCDGSARSEEAGSAEILAFARAHPRAFTAVRAAEVLAGVRSPRVARGYLDRLPEYGRLSGWERTDAEEAIGELVRDGRLRVVRWGPWAGGIAPGRRG